MARSSDKHSVTSLGGMNEVEHVFNKFDVNGDGKISAAELRAVLKALGSDTSSEEVGRVMAEIDTDGDGFIDLKEFTDFHRKGADSESDDIGSSKELRDAFDLYDRDKNGLISASELHAVLKNLGEKCSLADCSRMIGSVDVDGDGCVNFEEFKKMMKGQVTRHVPDTCLSCPLANNHERITKLSWHRRMVTDSYAHMYDCISFSRCIKRVHLDTLGYYGIDHSLVKSRVC